jgi:hypothetical protein
MDVMLLDGVKKYMLLTVPNYLNTKQLIEEIFDNLTRYEMENLGSIRCLPLDIDESKLLPYLKNICTLDFDPSMSDLFDHSRVCELKRIKDSYIERKFRDGK